MIEEVNLGKRFQSDLKISQSEFPLCLHPFTKVYQPVQLIFLQQTLNISHHSTGNKYNIFISRYHDNDANFSLSLTYSTLKLNCNSYTNNSIIFINTGNKLTSYVVGSSRKSTGGLLTSSRAMDTLFFWPPLILSI